MDLRHEFVWLENIKRLLPPKYLTTCLLRGNEVGKSGVSDFSLLAGPFLTPNGRIFVRKAPGDGQVVC